MIRIRFKFVLIILAVLFAANVNLKAGNDGPFVRYPSLNPDGTVIAFSFQGDIWTIPYNGGEAKRLTIHESNDYNPIWSPDGTQIAFNSDRYQSEDIFIIPAVGGRPQRLTYHPSGDTLFQWTVDGYLLFNTARVFRQIEWSPEMYSISEKGGTPKRFMDAVGKSPAQSPDKRYIAFERGDCRTARESYKGPANRDIWIYDTKTDSYSQVTDFKGNDYLPRWGDANTLYYISSEPGKYNIFAVTIQDGKVSGKKQMTHFKDFGVRFFNTGAKGNALVMERDTSIYTLNTSQTEPKKLEVNIHADYRFDPEEHKTYSNMAADYAVSPDGKLTAFVIRGEIFITENDKEKSKSVNVTRHPYRDQNPVWLNDKALLFISDRNGREDIFMVTSADSKQPNLFKTLKHKTTPITRTAESEHDMVLSPNLEKIAYIRGNGQLITADISAQGKLANEKVLLDGWAEPMNLAWSPDSKWLAYALSDLDFNDEVFIHSADNSKKPVNISMHPRGDGHPVWSPDGTKLGFLSDRNNGDTDVWFVWLNKKDWEKTKQDWDEEDDKPAMKNAPKKEDKKAKKSKDKSKEKEKKEVKPITIDFDGLYERLVQVTSMAGDETSLAIDKDGKTFYFSARAPGTKGRDLFSVQWDGSKTKPVTKGGINPARVRLTDDGKYLYLINSGRLGRIATKGYKMESLPFAAKMIIHYEQETRQIFSEAVRALTDMFYDPKFHGRDWQKLVAKYKPLALKASTRNDFLYMFNNMLGQIDASHMGMYGSGRQELKRQVAAILGVEIEPLKQGVKVNRVVLESPADHQRSKLAAGDTILSVDGVAIGEHVNFYSLLVNKAGEKTLLEVKDTSGNMREVVIRPTSNLRGKLYDEWVKERRKLVEKYSNGRLGYLHIRAMGWPSFERFEREITASGYGKEGIVIDVRFNGGGYTTDYLMAVLNVKQHAYTIPRGAVKDLDKENKKFREHYPYGERLPFASWTKPSIALCNANSYSNAEIFSHAFKTLGIGKLVGIPTFGAVISTGGKGLIDGTFVRLPFRAWYVKATGENMEHGPAVPDIILDNPPGAKAKGKDPQLKRAVDELIKDIDSNKNH